MRRLGDDPTHAHALDLAERMTLAAARGDYDAVKAIIAGVDLDDTEVRQTFGVFLSVVISGLAMSLAELTGQPPVELLERPLARMRALDLDENDGL